MKIEMRPTEAVTPYETNPRKNDKAVAAVAASIREFGFRQPVVVDRDGVLIIGHTRWRAAKQLGMAEIPVHVAETLSDAQVRALRIADNQTATIADWDLDLLPLELAGLKEMDFDLDILGFSERELVELMGVKEGETDPDAVPELPADPVTKPGDLYVLGDHRLLCGDSTNPAHVAKLLAGARPFLMVTDPPYGVAYDPAWRNAAGLCDTGRTGKVANDDRVDWTEAYKLFGGDVAYVWHAGRYCGEVATHLANAGLHVRTQIVWRKPRFAIGRGNYHWQHEPAWYCVREGKPSRWGGDRSQSTVWDIAHGDGTGETVHGTQKPCECMGRPIRNHGQRGDGVYDPFGGSGTTLIAAEQCGRKAFVMELDPAYCDVAVSRWESFSGRKAERVRANETAPAVGAGAVEGRGVK